MSLIEYDDDDDDSPFSRSHFRNILATVIDF